VLKKIAVDLLISDISLIDGAVLSQLAKEHQPTTQIAWTLENKATPGLPYCTDLASSAADRLGASTGVGSRYALVSGVPGHTWPSSPTDLRRFCLRTLGRTARVSDEI
jgi:hypothetical protein